MLETNRFGSSMVSSSSRVHETLVATRCVYGSFGGIRGCRSTTGSASTFFVMKTRPVLVAAHALDLSAVVLSTAATFPPSKFTSGETSKNEWKRKFGRATSKPFQPPSPIIVFSHFTVSPGVSQVPLSCVPPWSSTGLCGLAFTLIHCSVERPSLIPSSFDGIRESICSQRSISGPFNRRSGGLVHHDERSTNVPLDRITPPSFVSKNWNGLFGFVTMLGWPFGV